MQVDETSIKESTGATISLELDVVLEGGGVLEDEFITSVLEQLAYTFCDICWWERSSYGFARSIKMLIPNVYIYKAVWLPNFDFALKYGFYECKIPDADITIM